MAPKTERNIKVYLRDHFRGEVSAVHIEKDPKTGQVFKAVNVLKVFPEIHEPTGNILAYYVIATESERDSLWGSGLACDRYAAMGLAAPETERGKVAPLYDDPIPESHKVPIDLEIVEDETIEEAFEDEFNIGEEEVIVGSPEPKQDIPFVPNVLTSPENKNPKLEDIISMTPPIKKSLNKAGLKTVKDAVNKSAGDLEKLPGIGKTTAKKLFDALKSYKKA